MMPPGAWYDLSGRVSHARAVSACLGEMLPGRVDDQRTLIAINRIGDLAGAIEDILALAEADIEELERQLGGAG